MKLKIRKSNSIKNISKVNVGSCFTFELFVRPANSPQRKIIPESSLMSGDNLDNINEVDLLG